MGRHLITRVRFTDGDMTCFELSGGLILVWDKPNIITLCKDQKQIGRAFRRMQLEWWQTTLTDDMVFFPDRRDAVRALVEQARARIFGGVV